MDETIGTDVEIAAEATPQTVFELTDEWVAYLDQLPAPSYVAGIDESIRPLGDDDTRLA